MEYKLIKGLKKEISRRKIKSVVHGAISGWLAYVAYTNFVESDFIFGPLSAGCSVAFGFMVYDHLKVIKKNKNKLSELESKLGE